MSDDYVEEAEQEQQVPTTPDNDSVLNKYKIAGELATKILKLVIAKCVAGAKVSDLCSFGDQQIVDETSGIFKKDKKLIKGIAFPTCVSVNNVICNFSPIDPEHDYTLVAGDLAKVELGVHIDGFIGSVATTRVVGASKDSPVSGAQADLMLAAHTASEVLLRYIEPGVTNFDTSATFKSVLEDFGVHGVEDILSHNLGKFTYEGEKKTILCPSLHADSTQKKVTFELYDVLAFDCYVSNDEQSKPYVKDTRITVFRKSDSLYNPKLKATKELLRETILKTKNLPFNARVSENQSKFKVATKELVEHGSLITFEPLTFKDKVQCAQFKCTFVLTNNGPMRLTDYCWDQDLITGSETAALKKPELIAIAKRSLKRKFVKK